MVKCLNHRSPTASASTRAACQACQNKQPPRIDRPRFAAWHLMGGPFDLPMYRTVIPHQSETSVFGLRKSPLSPTLPVTAVLEPKRYQYRYAAYHLRRLGRKVRPRPSLDHHRTRLEAHPRELETSRRLTTRRLPQRICMAPCNVANLAHAACRHAVTRGGLYRLLQRNAKLSKLLFPGHAHLRISGHQPLYQGIHGLCSIKNLQ